MKEKYIKYFIFIFIFLTHFLSFNVTSFDSRWTVYTAKSIISEGNLNLNEYKNEIEENKFHGIIEIDEDYYNFFPVGVVFISIPFVFIFDLIIPPISSRIAFFKEFLENRSIQPIEKYDSIGLYHGIEFFIACLIIALTAVFIYKISRQKLDIKFSLLVVFIFAFCTSAWSIGSRGLWMHGPTMLLLSWSLYFLLEGKRKPELVKFTGLILAYAFVVRPTNIISYIIFGSYIFINFRSEFSRFITYSFFIFIPFIFFSFMTYNMILPPYYLMQVNILSDVSYSNFFGALLANITSPARGLFIFSPILIFSLYGIFLKFKNNTRNKIDGYILIIIIVHWIAISTFNNWWAGHSYGPRFFSDMIPYFIYFLIPVFYFIPIFSKNKKLVLYSLLILFISISFIIHFRGANERKVWVEWNQYPVDIDNQPSRIWDWKDLQFLR